MTDTQRRSFERVELTPGGRSVNHGGSGTAYANYGCRCDECCAANTKRVERRRKERVAREGDFEHGTSGYTNWGCRCDVCSEAQATKNHEAYVSRLERCAAGYTNFIHGFNGYTSWGCRCDICRAGARDDRLLRSHQAADRSATTVVKA